MSNAIETEELNDAISMLEPSTGVRQDDCVCETDSVSVTYREPVIYREPEVDGDTIVYPSYPFDDTCAALQELQRHRRHALKQTIALTNALTSTVAITIGDYHGGLEESERKKRWNRAAKVVKAVDKGKDVDVDPDVADLIRSSTPSREAYELFEGKLYKAMQDAASDAFPQIAEWLLEPERHGIAMGIVATIIGESGNLYRYKNPAKLWRRMFGFPFTKGGITKMPSAWSNKELSKADWMEIGYSPRRNATMYALRENIVKQNKGKYRKLYTRLRETVLDHHPEWCTFDKEGNVVLTESKAFPKSGHCHRHAQLLAAKLFVKDLWIKWWGPDAPSTRHPDDID